MQHLDPQLVHVEHHDRVAVVTLDDPARRNALSLGLCALLATTLEKLGDDPGTGAVVVTGAGAAFCAGADLTELGDSRHDGLLAIYEGFLAVARSPLPTVAAVNGPAVGAGLNLALACDLRVAGPDARFDCRFLDLGIHPGGGHTWMLRRLVGPQTAAAMLLFGQVLGPQEAARVGLVWECTEGPVVLERAVELAARAADAPADLVTATATTLADVADIDDHATAVELELERQLHSMDQPAFAERLAALRSRIRSEGS